MKLLEKKSVLCYWKRIKIAFQYLMPQLYLTQLAGWFAKQQWGALTHFVIRLFAKKYNVDMSEAKFSKFSEYNTFNDFFIRELKEDARKITEVDQALCLPADGRISQLGDIQNNLLLQAKGHYFSLSDLLAQDQELVTNFENGSFITTYLSPKDYHRVHMPCAGNLRKMIYVPGDLFSVNPFLAEHVPNLFARNERVICIFDTEFGQMAQILVGATITASISTVWAGVINPPRPQQVKTWTYAENEVKLEKGQEMGAFQLGSTVINLFQSNRIQLDTSLQVDSPVRMGDIMAQAK